MERHGNRGGGVEANVTAYKIADLSRLQDRARGDRAELRRRTTWRPRVGGARLRSRTRPSSVASDTWARSSTFHAHRRRTHRGSTTPSACCAGRPVGSATIDASGPAHEALIVPRDAGQSSSMASRPRSGAESPTRVVPIALRLGATNESDVEILEGLGEHDKRRLGRRLLLEERALPVRRCSRPLLSSPSGGASSSSAFSSPSLLSAVSWRPGFPSTRCPDGVDGPGRRAHEVRRSPADGGRAHGDLPDREGDERRASQRAGSQRLALRSLGGHDRLRRRHRPLARTSARASSACGRHEASCHHRRAHPSSHRPRPVSARSTSSSSNPSITRRCSFGRSSTGRSAQASKTVKGVIEVNSFGGELKQYQVVVDPAAARRPAASR